MKHLTYSKKGVVQFVYEELNNLKPDSPSITITIQAKSEGYSVSIVTDELSDDTELQMAKFFSETQVNT